MKTQVVQSTGSGAGPAVKGAEPVIRTSGLAKQFGAVHALEGLDLEVPERSIFGFLGPNGAGKTTTIKMLLDLARPTGGHARLFGLDSRRDSLAIRTRVGYLAQDPRFYPHMTARETLRFTASFFYRGPEDRIRSRIDETLRLVGLADKADRPTKGFSGGERQRLGIAQAQVNHPALLILDEPAAALDPLGRRDVLAVMERLREHTTIFYSTHILDDVQRVSDRVAILDHGRLVASEATADLLAGDALDYELTVRGAGSSVLARLQALPWITEVSAARDTAATTFRVHCEDSSTADAELLREVLADEETVVTGFGRKRLNLEDVFLRLVEGGTP